MEIEEDLADKIVKTSEFEEELSQLRILVDELDTEVRSLGKALSHKREKVFGPLKKELEIKLSVNTVN